MFETCILSVVKKNEGILGQILKRRLKLILEIRKKMEKILCAFVESWRFLIILKIEIEGNFLIDSDRTLYKMLKTFLKIQLNMNIESNSFETDSQKCQSCKVFFGAKQFQGFCSSCFKKQSINKKQQIEKSEKVKTEMPQEEKKEEKVQQPKKVQQVHRNRCFDCNKKVGLLGIQCKCGFVFCNGHRLPEDHNCNFDHREAEKQKLSKNMIKLEHQKIGNI